MSLSLAIAINALADAALAGGLAYVMSRTTRLTPHVSAIGTAASRPAPAEPSASQRHPARAGAARHPGRPFAIGLPS